LKPSVSWETLPLPPRPSEPWLVSKYQIACAFALAWFLQEASYNTELYAARKKPDLGALPAPDDYEENYPLTFEAFKQRARDPWLLEFLHWAQHCAERGFALYLEY
jgi:hypothetical protein